MMKKIMPKKRLISLFAAACILYGCSSAPVSSPKTETTAAIQSEESQEEKTETEETGGGRKPTVPLRLCCVKGGYFESSIESR